MTQPLGFSMVKTETPSPFLCDICTGNLSGWHIETFVGGAGQSTLCKECAEAAADLARPRRKREVEAVV